MRIRVSVFCVPFLVFMIILCFYVIAEAAGSDRDAIITKELDCVAHNLSKDKGLDWAEVCYTKERSMYEADPVFVNADNPAPALTDEYDMDAHNAPYTRFEKEPPETNYYYRFFDLENPLNTIEFGTEAFSYWYEEELFMELEGYMWGVYAVYTHRSSFNEHFETWKDAFSTENAINVFRIDVRGSYGLLDYDSNGSGTNDDEDHYTFEIRGILGEDIPVNDTLRVTPYFGVGYRYLLDDNGGGATSTGALTYDRESQYCYVPLGIEAEKKLNDNWSLGANLEFDLFIDGQQKSHLGDAIEGFDTVSNDQKDGYGFRGSVRLVREGENVDFSVEPFFRYWHIEDSEISLVTYSGVAVGYGLEPENETSELGVKISARF